MPRMVFRNGKLRMEEEPLREQIPIPSGYLDPQQYKDVNPFQRSPFEAMPEIGAVKEELYDDIDPSGTQMMMRVLGDLIAPESPVEIGATVLGAGKLRPFGVPAKAPTKNIGKYGIIESEPHNINKLISGEEKLPSFTPRYTPKKTDKIPEGELAPFQEYQGKYLSKGEAFEDLEPFNTRPKERGAATINPGKLGKAKKLIEENGGTDIKVNPKTGKISWKGKDGESVSADLNDRFGPRMFNRNSRAEGTSPRQTMSNPRSPLMKEIRKASGEENVEKGRGFSKESQENIDTKLGDLPGYEKERGAFGKPKPIPTVSLKGSYKYDKDINGVTLNFSNDFDKAAYTLAGGKPNNAMLREMSKLTGLDEQTILAHGERLRQKTAKDAIKLKKGDTYNVAPKQVRTIGEKSEKPPLLDEALMAPTAFKFGIDLPALRQSFRPTVLHPIKSGLPAIKNALKSVTESGFRNTLEELSNTKPYQRLEQFRALPGDTEKLYPNIKALDKLPSSDLDAFFLENSRLENIPGIGTHMIKPSRQMFDAYQKTIRGKEMERLAPDLDELLEGGPAEFAELEQIVNRISDETGHGTLGARGDKAADALSRIFTAPRNLAAKTQFYNPLNYLPVKGMKGRRNLGGLESRAYRDFIKDQGKLIAGTGAGLYAAKEGGADVDINPYSANAGVRFGNWKPDLFGGELGIMKQIARMNPFAIDRVSARGTEYEGSAGGDFMRFLRGRLRPGAPSMAYDLFSNDNDAAGYDPETGDWNPDEVARTNYLGEDIRKPYDETTSEGKMAHTIMGDLANKPYSRWIAQQFTPAFPSDVMDAAEESPQLGALAAGLGFMGGGSSTYDPFAFNSYRPPKKRISVRRRKPGEYERKTTKPKGSGNSGDYVIIR